MTTIDHRKRQAISNLKRSLQHARRVAGSHPLYEKRLRAQGRASGLARGLAVAARLLEQGR